MPLASLPILEIKPRAWQVLSLFALSTDISLIPWDDLVWFLCHQAWFRSHGPALPASAVFGVDRCRTAPGLFGEEGPSCAVANLTTRPFSSEPVGTGLVCSQTSMSQWQTSSSEISGFLGSHSWLWGKNLFPACMKGPARVRGASQA